MFQYAEEETKVRRKFGEEDSGGLGEDLALLLHILQTKYVLQQQVVQCFQQLKRV